MSTLRPVPETPPRAVLYLRQSISRDDSISLELQEAAGRDYAHRQGYTIVAVESDPGISGRTWKRPAVQRVMTMVERGDADIIILWKWSRLSRSRRDWAVAVDRVDVAGGRIESATEQVDVSTATGRLARGVLAEFAAFESDRIGEVWKEVHAARLTEGKTPNGKPRFGYQWNSETKVHEPDPITGAALAETYRRYIAGESTYSLVRWLNSEGIRTTAGGPWTDHALRRVMDAGFAAGRLMWAGREYQLEHERLVDEQVWQAYLDARAVRRRLAPGTTRSKYVLSGLVRCAKCGGPMVANPRGEGRPVSLRCSTSKEQGPGACAGGYVAMHVVEAKVLEEVSALAADVDEASEALGLASARRVDAEAETARLGRQVTKVDEALARLTRRLAEDLIPVDAYVATRDELLGERLVLVERLEDAGRRVRAVSVDRRRVAAGLLAEWDVLPVESRRELLRALFARVEVATGVRAGNRSTARVVVVPV